MEPITWSTTSSGTISDDASRSGATRLTSSSRGAYDQFDAAAAPDGTTILVQLHVPARSDYFGLYIDATTSAGGREFKFEPNGASPRLAFGSRYSVGLDSEIRGGEWVTLSLDLAAVAASIEPGVTIQSLDAMFMRVRGDVSVLIGSDDPPPPPPGGDISRTDAVRFLNQATFGASEATIAELQTLGSYDAWIDRQFALPYTSSLEKRMAAGGSSNTVYRHDVWWDNAMTAPDQLRQRLGFALSEIFVVSDLDYTLANAQWAITHYYDMLATGATGNFRDLLENVTLHPVMGIYLSMLRSERANAELNIRPDENFAREVLQLFSLGLHQLNIDGTVRYENGSPAPAYTQDTVENFAEAFTGWSYANAGWTANNIPNESRRVPMVPFEEYHEPSDKILLGGQRTSAGASATADMAAALDNIFAHPNVGPFVARSLIQRLVTSNPSSSYVRRVAEVFNANDAGVRGDLGAVVRAVLVDDEARRGHTQLPGQFGKFKEPLLRLTQIWRAFDAVPGPTAAADEFRVYNSHLSVIDALTGQAPLRSPSVFNFFNTDNPMPLDYDLVAPEHQILTEINVASTNNMVFSMIYDFNNYRTNTNAGHVTRINVDRALALVDTPAAMVDYVDEMLTAGITPAAVKTAIAQQVSSHPATTDGHLAATLDAIYCIAGSPFHLVQR